jgi:ATP-dependent helicase/DNAse subunit B
VAADFSPDSPVIKKTEAEGERHIYALELPFGQDGAPPLRLAEGLLARGMIDRIDQTPHGLVLMDYKSGSSTPSNKDLEEGRNFQMLLYLLALEQALPGTPIQGFFWSLATNKGQAQISAGDEKLGPAKEILLDLVAAARAGDFHSHPPKLEERKCSRYCDYSQLCRVANQSR